MKCKCCITRHYRPVCLLMTMIALILIMSFMCNAHSYMYVAHPCKNPTNPCQNGGNCNLLSEQSHNCTCAVGYIGDNCQWREYITW